MRKFRLFTPALAGSLLLLAARSGAVTFTQDFSADPQPGGWQTFGQTNLFRWNPTHQNLEVTWNSSQPNTFFHHPLGTILARDDDFSLAFDLRLDDIGPADAYLFSFELAVGFLNLDQATGPGFVRSSGWDSPNIVEFAYFRPDDFGSPATVYPTVIGTNSDFNYNPGEQNSTNYALVLGDWYRVSMNYTASNQCLTLVATNFAGTTGAAITQALNATFTDFRVTAVSVSSYNDAGQYPGYEGSILAHGALDNLTVTVPPPPVQDLAGAPSNGVWQAQFLSRTNWLYALERTTAFPSWTSVTATAPGNGVTLLLQDTNPPAVQAFYRVRACRP
jgi:hypothetical protein